MKEWCQELHVWFSNFDPRDEWIFSWLTSIRYDSLDGAPGNLVKMKLTWDSWSQSTISQFPWGRADKRWETVCDSSSSFRLLRWWDLLWVFSMIISHWAERRCAGLRAEPAGVTHHHNRCHKCSECWQERVVCKYYAKLLAAGWRHLLSLLRSQV